MQRVHRIPSQHLRRFLAPPLAGLALSALASCGTAEPTIEAPAGVGAAQFEIEAMADARGISIAEARERMRWQDEVPGVALRVADDLGSAFAGVWVDVNDGDRVKVGVLTSAPALRGLAEASPRLSGFLEDGLLDAAGSTGADPSLPQSLKTRGQILDVLGDLIESSNLENAADVIEVRWTLAELEESMQWLSNTIAELGSKNTLMASVRPDLNAIRLDASRERQPSAAERALIDLARSRLEGMLLIGTHEGPPKPEACAGQFCDPPLRGGIRIRNGSTGCTGAFNARSNSDNKWYMFTAGHCGTNHSGTWETEFTDGSGHDIGQMHNRVVGLGGDMAIMHVNNPGGWNPENWVWVQSSADTTPNQSYTINSEGFSFIGMRICMTGGTSGTDCGEVTALGVTATFTDGITRNNLGRASYCAWGDDSGAPLYGSHKAYGLHVGGPCGAELYQGILSAESALNVSIVH